MNTYCELNINNFDTVQKKLVPYILTKYPNLKQFWNHVEQQELFDNVPELQEAINNAVGQIPLKTYLLVVPDGPDHIVDAKLGANSIHRDTSIESTRLNWPILNSSSIETRMFNTEAEPRKLVLPTGETYLTYAESDCNLIGSFRLTKPTALHVHTIHGLYRVENPLPRYILSFNFEYSIEHLLGN